MFGAPISRTAFLLIAPQFLVAAILCFSPNFNPGDVQSQTLGSDFLQEYAGAYIVGSAESDRLYEPSHSRAIQHNEDLVGFTFPASEFYPMIYPPFYYLLLVPLSWLPYGVATKLWMVGLGLCISANIWLTTKHFPPLESHWLGITVATLFFTPLFVSLTMAHKSVVLLLILNATFLLLFHKKPFAAGAVFGLITFKPHLALVIGFAFLLKRNWRFVGGACSTVAGLVCLCFLRGPKPCIDYLMQCAGMLDYVQNGGYRLQEAHGIIGTTEFMVGAWGAAATDSMTLTLAGLGLALLFWIAKQDYPSSSPEFGLQFSALIVGTVLLSPHFYFYDLAILLLPMMLLGSIGFGIWKAESISPLRRRQFVYLVAGFFVASGCLTNIATATGVQPSLPLLFAALVLTYRVTTPQLLPTTASNMAPA